MFTFTCVRAVDGFVDPHEILVGRVRVVQAVVPLLHLDLNEAEYRYMNVNIMTKCHF